MKTPIILLVTNDPQLEDCVANTLLKLGGISHLARSAAEALEIVCVAGPDLDLAVIDCEHGPHAITLVNAINARCDAFPLIVVTGDREKQIEALAYAHGAIACLAKPVSPGQLARALEHGICVKDQVALVA